MTTQKITFQDWLNGAVEPYRKKHNIPPGLGIHLLIGELDITVPDEDFQKVRTFQSDAFNNLSDMLATLKMDLFEAGFTANIDRKDAIQYEIEDLKDKLDGSKIKGYDANGFSPDVCQNISNMKKHFESDGLTDEDKQLAARYEGLTENNERLRAAIIYKQIKKFEQDLKGAGNRVNYGEREKYHSDNYWDTAFNLYYNSNNSLNTWHDVYNHIESEMKRLGIELKHNSFGSFETRRKEVQKKRSQGN